MKKQKKQLIIVLVVFLVFLAVELILAAYNRNKLAKQEAESEAISLLTIDTDSITRFSFKCGGITYTYSLDGEDWILENDKSYDIDNDQIETILSNADEVTALEEVEDYGDLSDFGFDSPLNEITITNADDTYVIKVGSYNEMLSEYYINIEGDDKLYLADDSLVSEFDFSPEEVEVIEDSTESVDSTEAE